MEIVQYIRWTEKGEYDKFVTLIKSSKDDTELRELLTKEFKCQLYEANTIILRFANKIKELRKQK